MRSEHTVFNDPADLCVSPGYIHAAATSATGLARETIRKGRREISQGEAPTDRVRRPSAGRPRLEQSQPGLLAALEALVDPLTRGDRTSPLRWTCKSRAKLAAT